MKSKNRNFSAEIAGNHVVIKASHPDAKQLFWGWGSDQSATDMSFYGCDDHEDTWRGNPDYKLWMWTLDVDGVDRMIYNIEGHIDDRNYYSKREVPKARELLQLLKSIEFIGEKPKFVRKRKG